MVVAKGESTEATYRQVYNEIKKIKCDELFYRKDIGHQALKNNNVFDGKKMSAEILNDVKTQVDAIKKEGKRQPQLAVILVGANPASQVYVANKVRACEATGIKSREIRMDENISEAELIKTIQELNDNGEVDGILVQLPLPKHIDETKIIEAISPAKDVDGFHPINVAALYSSHTELVPCTPKGILHILKANNIEIDGKVAVVVGRSNIVGKPVAKLLLDANATVVLAHSRTKNLEEITRQADILVVAVGKKHFIDSRHVKPGAAIIDVGINRGEDRKLYGDVNFVDVLPVASFITPVPGGVGPLTIAMLLKNTLLCYNQNTAIKQ